MQWLFFEQYQHEPNIAVLRFRLHVAPEPPSEAEIAPKRAGGRVALEAMERHLDGRRFLVDERYSIADIALYAYTHVADEAGFDLAEFPAIEAWLDRVREQPGHVTIDA
jgi:glutathione S-transferase